MVRESDLGTLKAFLIVLRIFGWSIVGAILGVCLVVLACCLYNSTVPGHWDDGFRLWIQLVVFMLSPWVGGIFGAARATKKIRPRNCRTMEPRWPRVVLAGLGVVIVAAVFILWIMPDPAARITVENCNRIRVGMGRAEVEAILGPAGDYTTHPTDGYIGSGPWMPEPGEESWVADEAVIKVQFDGTSKVVRASFGGNVSRQANGFQVLRWRANRQWHRWFPE